MIGERCQVAGRRCQVADLRCQASHRARDFGVCLQLDNPAIFRDNNGLSYPRRIQ